MPLPYAPARWPAALATVLVWALAAAGVVFWGLRLTAPSDALAPPPVPTAPVATPDPAALARLLGAQAAAPVAAPALASRLVLQGVIADRSGQGAALIAIDGKPARPYRVGANLTDGYLLRSLDARAATIGTSTTGPPVLTLQLPARPLAPNPPRVTGAAPPNPS